MFELAAQILKMRTPLLQQLFELSELCLRLLMLRALLTCCEVAVLEGLSSLGHAKLQNRDPARAARANMLTV